MLSQWPVNGYYTSFVSFLLAYLTIVSTNLTALSGTMADPFSIASGAVGVISLGLTVCEGLVSYLSAFKGQDRDLDSLSQRVEGLTSCLNLLTRALPSFRAETLNAARQIEESIGACRSNISLLENKVTGFRRAQTSSLSRDKLRNITKKVSFPFKRDALFEISGAIDSLQLNLKTILAIASLYDNYYVPFLPPSSLTANREASSNQLNIQNMMNTKIDSVVAASGILSSSIQYHSQGITSLKTDLSMVQKDLDRFSSTLDPSLRMIMQRLDNLDQQFIRLQVSPTPIGNTIHDLVRELIQI